MGTTANLGFPYPDGGEVIDSSAIRMLAEAIDTYLQGGETIYKPTMITLETMNGWEAVIGGNVEPLRLYRIGRIVFMTGEVIWRPQQGRVNGDAIPTSKRQFASIPVGWRPAVRIRQQAVRSSTLQTELYIDQYNDGIAYFVDPICLSYTPGYNVTSQWITEA